MNTDTIDDEARREAVARIRARRGLLVHASLYVAINLLMIVIWAATGAGEYWPLWVHLGWGIGVVAHGAAVLMGRAAITDEQIRRELTRR